MKRDDGTTLALGAAAALAALGVATRRGSRGEDADPTRMAHSNLLSARQSADRSLDELKRGGKVPAWAADRITRADQHLDDVAGYLRGRRQAHGSAAVLAETQWSKKHGKLKIARTTVEEVIKAVKNAYRWPAGEDFPEHVVLYHSADASLAQKIHEEGLIPQLGSWVMETIYGATDNEDLIQQLIDEAEEGGGAALSYFDDQPTWVKIKTAMAMDKPYNEITRDDIREHGHLAIFILETEYEDDVWKMVPDDSYGEPKFMNLMGEIQPFYWTALYDSDKRREVPMGVEPGDYITAEEFSPNYTLTGDDLLAYLDWWEKNHKVEKELGRRSRKVLPFMRRSPLSGMYYFQPMDKLIVQ